MAASGAGFVVEGSFAPIQNQLFSNIGVSLPVAKFDELMEWSNRIQMNSNLYQFFNDSFSETLKIPPDLQKKYNWPERAEGLSTSQLALVLNGIPSLLPLVNDYFNSEQNLMGEALAQKTYEIKTALREKFESILGEQKSKEQIAKLADPTEPLLIKPADGSPAYTYLHTYLSHPRYENPSDQNSKIIPGDNLIQVWMDFITGAKKEIFLNIYEFDVIEIAKALIDANKAGVKVVVGIDKNTIARKEANKAVWDLLSGHKAANFTVTAVDSVSIDHQKLAERDADTPTAASLLSSGNITHSCLDPRGDAYTLPEKLRPKGSIPNANNLIVVGGQIPAKVIRNELKKTLINKARGERQYPISGSYLFIGPNSDTSHESPFLLLAFSPNGGLGDMSRDILSRMVLGLDGPILNAQFAFASPTLLKALLEKAKRDKNSGIPFDFKSVSENSFTMRDYSTYLALAGLKIDPQTQKYVDDPEAPIRQILTDSEVKDLQKQILIAPPEYREKEIKLSDGRKTKISAKMHHKLWLFSIHKISTPGTSFNTSEGAEKNQEQFVITNDPGAYKILEGGFAYLRNGSRGNIAEMAKIRNTYRRPPPKLPKDPEDEIRLKETSKNALREGFKTKKQIKPLPSRFRLKLWHPF